MALNIKNKEVDALADEIAGITGESKTEAIRKALLERRSRLLLQVTKVDLLQKLTKFLEGEAWPQIPKNVLGKKVGKKEVEDILGFGKSGV